MSRFKWMWARVATCLSCGAPYGSAHGPDCEFRVHGAVR